MAWRRLLQQNQYTRLYTQRISPTSSVGLGNVKSVLVVERSPSLYPLGGCSHPLKQLSKHLLNPPFCVPAVCKQTFLTHRVLLCYSFPVGATKVLLGTWAKHPWLVLTIIKKHTKELCNLNRVSCAACKITVLELMAPVGRPMSDKQEDNGILQADPGLTNITKCIGQADKPIYVITCTD